MEDVVENGGDDDEDVPHQDPQGVLWVTIWQRQFKKNIHDI